MDNRVLHEWWNCRSHVLSIAILSHGLLFFRSAPRKWNFVILYSFLCLYFTLMRNSLTVCLSTIIKSGGRMRAKSTKYLYLLQCQEIQNESLYFCQTILPTFNFSALLSHDWQQCQKWFRMGSIHWPMSSQFFTLDACRNETQRELTVFYFAISCKIVNSQCWEHYHLLH